MPCDSSFSIVVIQSWWCGRADFNCLKGFGKGKLGTLHFSILLLYDKGPSCAQGCTITRLINQKYQTRMIFQRKLNLKCHNQWCMGPNIPTSTLFYIGIFKWIEEVYGLPNLRSQHRMDHTIYKVSETLSLKKLYIWKNILLLFFIKHIKNNF